MLDMYNHPLFPKWMDMQAKLGPAMGEFMKDAMRAGGHLVIELPNLNIL